MLKAPIGKGADRQTLLSKSVKVLSHPDFAVSVVFRLRCHSTDQHPHPKKSWPEARLFFTLPHTFCQEARKSWDFQKKLFSFKLWAGNITWRWWLQNSQYKRLEDLYDFFPKWPLFISKKIAHYSAYMENFCCSAFWVGWCWKCLWQSLVCSHHFGI